MYSKINHPRHSKTQSTDDEQSNGNMPKYGEERVGPNQQGA